MSRKRAAKRAALPGIWTAGTSLGEVVKWASQRMPEFLLLYADAIERKDREHAIEDLRLLRGVVTKLDQFRRLKVREWNRPIKSNTETEQKQEC